MLSETLEGLEGGQGTASVVVEEAAVEPPSGHLVVEGVLFGIPPEEACHVVVAAQFAHQLAGELLLSLRGDGVVFAVLVGRGPRVAFV